MGFSGIGIILMLLAIGLAMADVDLIFGFFSGWKRTLLQLVTTLVIGVLVLAQSVSFIAYGEREASKECLNGNCPYEQEIRYKDTDTGKAAVDTVYHLK